MTRRKLVERLSIINDRIECIYRNSESSWHTFLMYRSIGHKKTDYQLNVYKAEVKAIKKLTYIFYQTITNFIEQ